MVVSSAYMLTIVFWVAPGMMIPCRVSDACSRHTSGSMVRSKRRHERGSPCHTPLITWKVVLSMPYLCSELIHSTESRMDSLLSH